MWTNNLIIFTFKSAINENYKKFKSAFKAGQISTTEYEQYNNVMKDALRKSLSDLCESLFESELITVI
jgi:hypothetical protein